MDGDRGLCHLTLLLCLPRGVCLSFLVAAPLILLVFSTFLVGGNVQTLLCRSWESGELYEVSLSPPPRTPRARGGSEQSKGLGRKWRLEGQEGERGRGMMETKLESLLSHMGETFMGKSRRPPLHVGADRQMSTSQ